MELPIPFFLDTNTLVERTDKSKKWPEMKHLFMLSLHKLVDLDAVQNLYGLLEVLPNIQVFVSVYVTVANSMMLI